MDLVSGENTWRTAKFLIGVIITSALVSVGTGLLRSPLFFVSGSISMGTNMTLAPVLFRLLRFRFNRLESLVPENGSYIASVIRESGSSSARIVGEGWKFGALGFNVFIIRIATSFRCSPRRTFCNHSW